MEVRAGGITNLEETMPMYPGSLQAAISLITMPRKILIVSSGSCPENQSAAGLVLLTRQAGACLMASDPLNHLISYSLSHSVMKNAPKPISTWEKPTWP